MRVKVFGGGSGYGPDGVMTSWAPNSVVEVDDADEDAVEFYGRWVDAGTAELLEPAKAKAKATAKATATASTATPPPPAPGPEPPPKAGAGSSRDAWAAYAAEVGVEVTDDMTRDDIVEAVEAES